MRRFSRTRIVCTTTRIISSPSSGRKCAWRSLCRKTTLAREKPRTTGNQSDDVSTLSTARCSGREIDENNDTNNELFKRCPICNKCYRLYNLPTTRELPPEGDATADISGVSALSSEEDLLQGLGLKVRKALEGGGIVWLDEAMVWLLDVRKANSLDSVIEKYLRNSVRVVLEDVTRSLACGIRKVEMKGTRVGETFGRDLFVYASPDDVKDEHLVPLHQAAHHDRSEAEHARNNGEYRELWWGVRESRAGVIHEIYKEKERANMVREAAHIIRNNIIPQARITHNSATNMGYMKTLLSAKCHLLSRCYRCHNVTVAS